ncbi:methyl-accepting chemotaxis protein [Neorhizobium sp. T25_13]|uniref:methyl-accepting chemotaxis protein n=1 Tax=Neorhizobium sp. T25_13 TaxID=2093830 RepID=UPI00155F00D3|nr:methyl-accepting chemotaxis protein [Neorhizobium sp. T25_13]
MSKISFTISQRLALSVVIPAIASVITSAVVIKGYYDDYADYSRMETLMNFASAADLAVHELQVERGRTATFLGSGGKRGGDSLIEARSKTDKALFDLEDAITGVENNSASDGVFEFDMLKEKLSTLEALRSDVDGQKTDGASAITAYTAVVATTRGKLDVIPWWATDPRMSLEASALASLALMKEFAGQQRAMVAQALSTGKLSEELRARIHQADAKQVGILDLLSESYKGASQDRLREMSKAPAFEQFEPMRQAVLSTAAGTSIEGVEPDTWFKAASARIDELRKLEVLLASGVKEQSVLLANAAWELVLMWLCGAVGILLAVAAIAVVIARSITTPITKITRTMGVISRGDFGSTVPFQDRTDEIGTMAVAVAVFRQNGLERQRLEAEAEANRSLSEKERQERERRQAEEAAQVTFAVDNLATGLGALADGKLSFRLQTAFTDRLDKTRIDFNAAIERLEDALRCVGQNAQAIATGSDQIRSAADDLSKRTEQQAASVEQTAAALEQITTTVADSSRRADEAARLVATTRDDAERSGVVVSKAVDAMHDIERSSSEISNIIGVIDEIAFQTNLLALNAGVEAARAGEAGKGFAVVAQEVRELAQRSATAAKEIKDLIRRSGEQVKNGVELVGATGTALARIVKQVKEIDDNVSSIVESSKEQSTGIKEINNAVALIDQGTQQNAAMVEESTAASHSLAREAEALFGLIGIFQIADQPSAGTSRAAPAEKRPSEPPARQMVGKRTSAFKGNAALQQSNWREF